MWVAEPHVAYNDLDGHTFAQWLLDLSEKKLLSVEDKFVRCLASTLFNRKNLIDAIYPGIGDVGVGTSREYLSKCFILVPCNEEVLRFYSANLDRLPKDKMEYLSADQADDVEATQTIPMEFLHSIEVSGFPSHKLCLKVGAPIMLLRNLNPSKGLCNGMRLIVKRLFVRVIEVEILTGRVAGNIEFLLRITFIFDKNGLPFPLHKRYFPIRVAHAMTINKSQGQTKRYVGLHLVNDVFTHGQLYVAFSRATVLSNVKVLLGSTTKANMGLMCNVIYEEAFL
jgi:hypothetical protein